MDAEDIRISLCECQNAFQVTNEILSLKSEKKSLVVILLWTWWTVRNKANAEEKIQSPEEVCFQIQKFLSDFSSTDAQNANEQTQVELWLPPRENFIKVNFDAAFCQNTNEGAWGFIARSEDGSVLLAGAGCMKHMRSALHAEAYACIQAIERTSNLGAFRVIFESDSLNLVNALKSGDHDMADIGVLYREARSLYTLAFDSFEFSFCRRLCNKVAHAIAQHGRELGVVNSSWSEDASAFVSALVASDIATHRV
jgi:ribonuclease HI